jgi:hypothetical protein
MTRYARQPKITTAKRTRKTKRKGTLADFFAVSPLRNSGLKLKRVPGRMRKVNL